MNDLDRWMRLWWIMQYITLHGDGGPLMDMGYFHFSRDNFGLGILVSVTLFGNGFPQKI